MSAAVVGVVALVTCASRKDMSASGQSTALCPATHPVAHIAPPPRACRNMGSNAGPGVVGPCVVVVAIHGLRRGRPLATVPGLESGAACWPQRLDALWVLLLHGLCLRPGPPQLMSAPRDPARLLFCSQLGLLRTIWVCFVPLSMVAHFFCICFIVYSRFVLFSCLSVC
jgi:hypothetical protein